MQIGLLKRKNPPPESGVGWWLESELGYLGGEKVARKRSARTSTVVIFLVWVHDETEHRNLIPLCER